MLCAVKPSDKPSAGILANSLVHNRPALRRLRQFAGCKTPHHDAQTAQPIRHLQQLQTCPRAPGTPHPQCLNGSIQMPRQLLR